MGQVVSWGAGFPVFLVTAYGALTNLYHSNTRWTIRKVIGGGAKR